MLLIKSSSWQIKNRLHGDERRRGEEAEVRGLSRDSGEGQSWDILNGERSHTCLWSTTTARTQGTRCTAPKRVCIQNLMWLYKNVLQNTKRINRQHVLHAKTNIQRDQWFISNWLWWTASFERTHHMTHRQITYVRLNVVSKSKFSSGKQEKKKK